MNTASGQAIEQALEQVAELFADGQLDAIETLLPTIIANGDDIQRQMGEIYREQLELLRAEAGDDSAVLTPNEDEALQKEEALPTEPNTDNVAFSSDTNHQAVEQALEQVAERFADGALDDIEPLLLSIMADGDEIQRQMADMYREQLALLRMEEGSAIADAVSYSDSDGLEPETLSPPAITTDAPPLSPVDDSTSATQTYLAQLHAILDEAKQRPRLIFADEPEQDDAILDQAIADLQARHFDSAIEPLRKFILHGNAIQQYLAKHHLKETIVQLESTQDTPIESIDEGEAALSSTDVVSESLNETAESAQQVAIDSTKASILAERVLERAVALIGINNNKAMKLLHSIIEADDNSEQQARAQAYLAEIEAQEAAYAVEAIKAQEEVESVVLPQSPVIEPDAVLADLHKTPSTPSVLEPVSAIIEDYDPLTDKGEELTYANIDGLRRPSEVLQTGYDFGALPSWNEGIDILQQEREGHQRQGFYIGDIGLMIDFSDGSELMEMPATYRVPNAPPWLIGLTNIHSIIIPVFDLVGFWGLRKVKESKAMLMVIGHGDASIGIVIYGLPKRLNWQDQQTVDHNTAPSRLRRCIRTACLVEGELWFDLDCTALTEDIKSAMKSA